ncbi:hypothetical protein [Paenibacillus lemnae]|uniref:Restriction endonuclease subunit S n=1 Tax=Paenibacillus lemnae TaxID=1330551 RepID=A0A848M6L0_PAELE|nr:hypothetical protein [Paenibacillus lemnae]NMO95234.1 hypothetical protein [Paenibacillus lemnae]
MSREESLMRMLDAAVSIQRETALILAGKAVEAEKVRQWVLHYETDRETLKEPLMIHEQIVEQIEGLTRIGTGLCRNLRAVLETGEEEDDDSDFEGFDFGDSDG